MDTAAGETGTKAEQAWTNYNLLLFDQSLKDSEVRYKTLVFHLNKVLFK